MAFLNISTKNRDGVLKEIDESNYLGLKDCSRLELYSFMVALGFERGYATEFDGAKDALVREEYARNSNLCHAFSALYFLDNKDHIEDIANTDKVYALSDKYANTGFNVISEYLNDFSPRALAMKLLADMDEMYEKYKDTL